MLVNAISNGFTGSDSINKYHANDIKQKSISSESQKSTYDEKKYSIKQVGGAVLATALSAAVIGGAVMHGKSKSKIRQLKNKNSEISQVFETSTKELRDGLNKTMDNLRELLEGDLTPKDARQKLYDAMKKKIDEGKLNYDVSSPPDVNKFKRSNYEKAVPLPETVGTYNRSHIEKLNIPSIGADGSFDYKLPMSAEVKITHMPSKDFKPVQNQLTNITENYADSVQWDRDKIARDMLQNFFDGHGHTLDGVQLTFSPIANGKFRIRIKGDSTYTADKAVFIGESTKRTDVKAAGNYGEGLKMTVLKILKDGRSPDVKIVSDNWKLTYSLANSDLSDKRVLSYNLDKIEPYDGNYIEFETSDRELMESLRKSINRFYHSGNEHFKCPDFENELLGVKMLAPNEKGGVYISGQKFEFNGKYEELDNVIIFLKEKPPVEVLDPSRDRISLNSSNLKAIAQWLAKDSRTSNEDKVNLLRVLEPYWKIKLYSEEEPLKDFVESFVSNINGYTSKDPLYIKFPDKYLSYTPVSDDLFEELLSKGYVICMPHFKRLGMQTIYEFISSSREHDVIMPTAEQRKKILILKEALQVLSKSLKEKYFSADELDTKIYLFDRTSLKDAKISKNTLAEAIIDNYTSKGFWIDTNYLNNAKFGDILETALHELSHKAGGDESSEFSYKLTNVNKAAIQQILNDVLSRNALQNLNKLWDKIGSNNTVSSTA